MMVIAGAAVAQPALPPDEAMPLAGPQVHDANHPGRHSPFAGPDQRGRRAGGVPNRVFVGAIRSLGGDVTPEELRLTDKQRAEIRVILQRLGQRAHNRKQHEQERREKQGRTPSAAERAASSRRVSARVWALLTPGQQELARTRMQSVMQKLRAERRHADRAPHPERRGDRALQPRAEEARPFEMNRGGRPGINQTDAALSGLERFERLWGRIEKLPPRARERVITRLEKALDRLEHDRVRQSHPAPMMDDVELPPEDDDAL